jgi:hypothetical protein
MYMGNRLITELPQCRGCGRVLVTEAVALSKVAEAEAILEDK